MDAIVTGIFAINVYIYIGTESMEDRFDLPATETAEKQRKMKTIDRYSKI